MIFERYKDILGGIFWVVVATTMYNASFNIRALTIGAGSSGLVGSGFMPRMVAIGMIILGAVVIFQGIKKLQALSGGIVCEKLSFREQYLPVVVSMVLLIAYVGLMEQVGFMIMTVAYLFGQMYVLAADEHRRPVMFLAISIISAAAIYYTFVEVFQLMLPESRLF